MNATARWSRTIPWLKSRHNQEQYELPRSLPERNVARTRLASVLTVRGGSRYVQARDSDFAVTARKREPTLIDVHAS